MLARPGQLRVRAQEQRVDPGRAAVSTTAPSASMQARAPSARVDENGESDGGSAWSGKDSARARGESASEQANGMAVSQFLELGVIRKGFCQEGFLSGSGLCQEGILSGKVFVRKRALPGRNFVRKGFCQEAGSARKDFCQERFLSGSGLCQEGILSGKVFVRKRALPGRGSQLWSWVVGRRRVGFGVGWWYRPRFFCFGGTGASQPPGL